MVSPAKLSHFFKIILSHNFKDTGLKIPTKFMKEHGKNMSNQVSLYVPGGGLWQVELTNINNGEFWLKKGWREFADRYSIQHGYFLVFRYEGSSVFNVIIFDMSASEIEYPTKDHVNGDSQKGADQGIQTDDHSMRKKSPVTYFLRSKKAKVDSVIKSEDGKLNEKFQGSQTNMMKASIKLEDMNPCLQEFGVNNVGVDTSIEMKTRAPNGIAERSEALRLANAFKSKIKNPSSFVLAMKPSYVSSKTGLNINRNFAVRYLNKKHNNCILQVSDGRTWPVKYMVYPGSAKLNMGWWRFAVDNSLAIDDVCVFELVSKRENLLKVSIFRAP